MNSSNNDVDGFLKQKDSVDNRFSGFFEQCSATGIMGWAAKKTKEKLTVEIIIDDILFCSTVADIYREDLFESGINDGEHSFCIVPPNQLFDGDKHKVAIREKETGLFLEGSPKYFQATSSDMFQIKIDFGNLIGWARLTKPLSKNRQLQVVDGDSILTYGVGVPNNKNPYIVDFNFDLPSSVFDGTPHIFSVRCLESETLLATLITITPTSLTPQEALQKYAREGLRSQMTNIARLRYESIIESLESTFDNNSTLSPKTTVDKANQLLRIHKNMIRGFDEYEYNFKPLFFTEHNDPEVSIIIPFHNKFSVTYHCLMSILLTVNEATYEVILVDDGSTDKNLDFSTLIKGVQYIKHDKSQGFVRACNAGARQARGQYVLMLNNDTEVTTRWLDELLWPFNNFNDVGMVGAKLLYPDGTLQEAGGIVWDTGDPWNYGRNENPNDTRYNYARQVDYLSGACMVLSKQLWDEIGGFDELYVPAYFEDTDLAFQVRSRGLKTVYTPLAQVIHFEGASNGQNTDSGIKKFQEINRPKFKKRWIGSCRTHGKKGHEIELNKDRNVDLRALVIDAETPRPDKNAGSYAAIQEIRMLQALGFKCTFVPSNLAWLGHYTEDLQRMGIETLYAPYASSIYNILENRGREFNIIYITRYYIAQEFIQMIRKHAPQAKVLLNNADLHFLRELRSALLNKDHKAVESSLLTREDELAIMRNVDLVLSYTEVEKAVILSHNLDSTNVVKCPWVANVVDNSSGFHERKHIAFLGGFNHSPNVEAVEWFADNVLRKLAISLPDIKFCVYGSHIPANIYLLSETHTNMEVIGWVPSVKDVYNNCRVFVAPLQSGAGIKGKVIDALAHGVPSLVSPIAAEGIPICNNQDAFICDKPEEWLQTIQSLYSSESEWNKISKNSKEFARRNYNINNAIKQMKFILEEVDVFASLDNKTLYYNNNEHNI